MFRGFDLTEPFARIVQIVSTQSRTNIFFQASARSSVIALPHIGQTCLIFLFHAARCILPGAKPVPPEYSLSGRYRTPLGDPAYIVGGHRIDQFQIFVWNIHLVQIDLDCAAYFRWRDFVLGFTCPKLVCLQAWLVNAETANPI